MAKVEMMDVMVAMAKAILEVAGEVATVQAEDEKKAEKPAKKEKVEKAAKAKPEAKDTDDGDNADLENKTTKELYQMCIDAGIKVPKYGKNKQFYIEQLTGGTQDEDEDVETEDTDDEQAADEYAGKTAKELFELCKKRGIKAAPKKKADVYIKMLKEADAAEAEAEDDDDWGDEEEETTKPAKKAKPKAAAKKPAKAEEDDDDDWDI